MRKSFKSKAHGVGQHLPRQYQNLSIHVDRTPIENALAGMGTVRRWSPRINESSSATLDSIDTASVTIGSTS